VFDPYEKWLGIPRDRRPVNYYQLLGIDAEETDPDVIQDAAERRADLVRSHQDGQYAEWCARILKEIEQAGATLYNPVKRKQYDAELRQTPAGKRHRHADDSAEAATKHPRTLRRDRARKNAPQSTDDEQPRPSRTWLWLALGGGTVLMLLVITAGAVVLWLLTRPAPTPAVAVVAEAPASNPVPPPVPAPDKEPERPAPTPPPAPVPKPPPQASPPSPATLPPVTKLPEPPPAPKIVKYPVPSAEEQARAEKELREQYKADYAKKAKLTLACKLLQPGRENRKDPAAWYVLLREARDLAVQGNGPRVATEAIREMDQYFIVDAQAMTLKALTTIAQAPDAPAAAAVAETALGLASRAVDHDLYDAADKLIATAETALSLVRANRKQIQKHVKLVAARKRDLQGFIKDHKAFLAAREKLAKTPEAADANLTVGKYLCFFHGRWDEGLPYLVKGDDALVKTTARNDLARPAEADRQMTVAKDWWRLSDEQPDRQQLNLRRRARFWYERVGQGGKPVDRIDAGLRIKEVDAAEAARMVRLLPGSYYGRSIEDRVLLLREGGGTMKSEEAIERGLDWLKRHQSPNGQWSNDAFGANCGCGDPGHKFDIAGTAFGLLPFLGVGQTHKSGPNAKAIYRGLAFLLGNQKKEGNYSDNMYENALATIVVCEAYGMTRDAKLAPSAQAALAYIVRAQNDEGGWGYSPRAKGDTSVTGWQFTALKAGVYAGLAVPLPTFDLLSRYLDIVEEKDGLGYGYNAPGAARATSAVGLLCREFLGWGPAHPRLARGVKQLFQPANFPNKDRLSIYFIFYATQMIHHAGGKNWEEWNPKVRDLLIELQDQGKQRVHQKGSWSPQGDDYAAQGGRLMFTSLALITLEVYYYHIPLYGHGPAVLLD
jgi:hypothetical protein